MKNEDNTQLGIGLAFLTIGAIVFFWLIVAFAVFLTALAAIACFHPLKVGKFTIESHEARAFILRGAAGAIVAPLALFFLTAMFGLRPNWDAILGYVSGGGYILASIGWEVVTYEEPAVQGITVPLPSPVSGLDQYEQRQPPPAQLATFRFAEWDDDGARK